MYFMVDPKFPKNRKNIEKFQKSMGRIYSRDFNYIRKTEYTFSQNWNTLCLRFFDKSPVFLPYTKWNQTVQPWYIRNKRNSSNNIQCEEKWTFITHTRSIRNNNQSPRRQLSESCIEHHFGWTKMQRIIFLVDNTRNLAWSSNVLIYYVFWENLFW